MRVFALALASALLLSGCSSPEPAAERSEEDFLAGIKAFGGSGVEAFSDAELIESGDSACANAQEAGRSISDARDRLLDYAASEQNAGAETLDYLTALYDSAGAFLCPEQEQ